jgi:hypothetical protein
VVSPEVVVLAIRAALQLYGASRRAYIDGTLGRPLILPLPRAPGIDWSSADTWFRFDDTGKQVARQYPRIQTLVARTELAADEKSELVELYVALYAQHHAAEDSGAETRGHFTGDQLAALLEVRQWAKKEYAAAPTALQTMAGTLINLAVDYFAKVPGALSDKRPEGRALKSFFEAIDVVDFADSPVEDIAGDVMIAVLESVSSSPDLLAVGSKEQELVRNVAQTMAEAATIHLVSAPQTERWEAATWLHLLTRSLLESGAETVLEHPVRFLGVHPGAQASAVTEVGRSVANLLLGDEKITFRRLLSAEGLDSVVRSAVDAVAQNPELLKLQHRGLEGLLVATARDVVAAEERLAPDLFPELVRMLLESSAEHMEVVWPAEIQEAEKHLLVTASRTLLQSLAKAPPAGATWKPRLTRGQVLAVVEATLDEVVDNPDWLLARTGESDPRLALAVDAMLESLQKLDGRRIGADTGVAVLRAGLAAAATSEGLMGRLPAGGEYAGQLAIGAALDAIFLELFREGLGADAKWRLARSSVLRDTVVVGLGELAKTGALDAGKIAIVGDQVKKLAAGSGPVDLEAFGTQLAEALAA